MQYSQQKCIVNWPALLNDLNIKLNSVPNGTFIKKIYHQKFCKKCKNIKTSF